jgi:ABC-type uncharacterized transport system involved in gliding motility auxiliary subunit
MSDDRNPTIVQKLKEAFRSFQWSSLAPFVLLIGIVSLFVAAIMFLIRGQTSFEAYTAVPLIIGVLGILLFGLLDPERLQHWLGSRQMRYGLNVVIMTVALVGILVVVNYIVYQEAGRRTLWVDLTEGKSNSLAPETLRTLEVLTQPVEVRAYFSASNYSWDSTLVLLDKYKSASGGKLTYQKIDPNANPIMAQNDKVTADATLVLASGKHTELVSTLSEQQITTALIKLENPGENKVFFLTGHEEASLTATGDGDISQVNTALQAKSYQTETLDLRQTGTVPQDAKALIIAGPKQPLLANELAAVKTYLKGGGSLILLENPYPLTQMTPENDVLAQYLAADWGVVFQNDIVIDMVSGVPLITIASGRAPSSITSTISSYLLFPSAQSLTLTPDSAGALTQTRLITVGDMGQGTWGETNFNELGDMQIAQTTGATYEAATDIAAPLVVATTIENTGTNARVVVVGDEDFAENKFVTMYANRDLLTNAIDWATRQEKLINLTPQKTTDRILLPPEMWVKNAITITAAVLLPGSFLVVGLIVWYFRRRHK